MKDAQKVRAGGKDAVCFTAGAKGAAFGAGVIHAWLASDREPPLVAAGISTGALSAAAMQQAYRELEGPARTETGTPQASPGAETESRRWAWFRRYLNVVTDQPLQFLWKAIPNPVEFFADKPPVNDTSASEKAGDQADARRHFHLLTKLGVWLGGLPVRVSTVAAISVHYVRWKEQYPWRILDGLLLLCNAAKAACGVWWRVLWAPGFFPERHFRSEAHPRRGFFRPLFGWLVWGLSLIPLAGLPLAFISRGAFSFAGLLFAPALLLIGLLFWKAFRNWLGGKALAKLDLEMGLLSQFEFRRVMFDLFQNGFPTPELGAGGKRMHLLLVCAALEQTKQVWPAPAVDLVTALSAAMCTAGVFPPVPIDKKNLNAYLKNASPAAIIDGVAVRSNPIPAFFDWCAANPDQARQIEPQSGDPENLPKLHVVYSVPTGAETAGAALEKIDIVDSALISMALAKRRDTRQEVRQTNFLAALESVRRRAAGSGWTKEGCFRIFADEIAPASEIPYRNQWEPTRVEGLAAAAQGCRTALETIYRGEILKLVESGCVACSALLGSLASRRAGFLSADTCGLPEICGQCARTLACRPAEGDDPAPSGVIQSYGEPGPDPAVKLDEVFPHLTGDEPRIVFLGSGGVFRGAFHIGAIAAMKAAGIHPDLVVGASVGALMGGALAAISVAPEPEKNRILGDLASCFLEVDSSVALTASLKNAAKQIGIRARSVDISPSELRGMMRGGSRADAGFAATGAPPALIDAISNLFMIPHRRTSAIASSFVAGHITEAVHRFLAEVRRETLTSFEIQTALMGSSLLEPQARKLLGEDVPGVSLTRFQPYHCGGRKVSFFCTTSFLNERVALLLGRDFLTEDPTWDFVFATLCSSAFPAVFSPRSEAELLPGRGRTDRLFADGGMFDNLPFFPALEIMGAVQAYGRSLTPASVMDRLKARTGRRDIFIAAGLDAKLADPLPECDNLSQVQDRAKSLSVDSKVETFVNAAGKTQRILVEIAKAGGARLTPEDLRMADGAVPAAILQIVPADKDHINPTFAFCRSVGMDRDRVRRSIAHGCFRSLAAFIGARSHDDTKATFAHKIETGQFQPLEYRPASVEGGGCPYFRFPGKTLECPFDHPDMKDEVRRIRTTCAGDKTHRKMAAKSV